jgi:adenosylcobyric acid synthase
LRGLHLEAEDALPQDQQTNAQSVKGNIRIIVPVLPRISNHTDFDPLRLHPQVDLQFVALDEEIPAADIIILPGSKSVRDDLAWLRDKGWDAAIERHLRYGGKLMGICGGFQMLGKWIHDPHGIEGESGSIEGLGLFDMETTLQPEKQLRNVHGKLSIDNAEISGYEIHAGVTCGAALEKPAIQLEKYTDGAISEDNLIFATYLHGLFESSAACATLLGWAGLKATQFHDYHVLREADINRVADMVEQHLDTDRLLSLLDLEAIAE